MYNNPALTECLRQMDCKAFSIWFSSPFGGGNLGMILPFVSGLASLTLTVGWLFFFLLLAAIDASKATRELF